MTDGRDVVPGGEVRPDGRAAAEGDHSRTADARARYLAKAASLGQIVREDEPSEHFTRGE